ncbi:hypothetical protein KKF69_04200, partial [Patescibacteria group bacterium]|nr:hypothetical protein [Patescibacteria group bacterium]
AIIPLVPQIFIFNTDYIDLISFTFLRKFIYTSQEIYTKTPETAKYTRENKPGIVLLQLITEKGSLNYNY